MRTKSRSRNMIVRKAKTSSKRRASARLTFASVAAALKFVIDKGLAIAVEKKTPAPDKHALSKLDPTTPCFIVTGPQSISIKAGTKFSGISFAKDTPLRAPAAGFITGADYGVVIRNRKPVITHVTSRAEAEACMGGFHFAPGGNAPGHSGGDSTPQINPKSAWDQKFRIAGADPRGTEFETLDSKPYWLDTYFLGRDHLVNGTSAFGVTIADGNDPPQKLDGAGYFDKLDYATAVAVYARHGKTLASVAELTAAADGVTENSSAKADPKITGLDAARTGRNGLQQATGNVLAWCHDGTPEKRASFFGGSWLNVGYAGSRFAYVDLWPGYSFDYFGARGRGDHLQLD